MKRFFTLTLAPILVIGISILVYKQLINAKQAPPKRNQPSKTTLVETINASPKDTQLPLSGFGTLTAQHQYQLIAEVSGSIIWAHPKISIGQSFSKGTSLFKIDPTDYQARLNQELANQAKAQLSLTEEKSRELIAKREWQALDIDQQNEIQVQELSLRTAYLAERQQALKAANSTVSLAKRNIQRTNIKAPCNGLFLSQPHPVGQYISLRGQIGKFVCTDAYEVIASFPVRSISGITINDPYLKPTIEQQPAELVQILPELDERTKMAQLLFRLQTPLKIASPIKLGKFVEVRLQSPPVNNIYTLPEKALRDNNTLWILNPEQTLTIMTISVHSRQNAISYITIPSLTEPSTLEVITSEINAPYQNMPLKTLSTR